MFPPIPVSPFADRGCDSLSQVLSLKRWYDTFVMATHAAYKCLIRHATNKHDTFVMVTHVNHLYMRSKLKEMTPKLVEVAL